MSSDLAALLHLKNPQALSPALAAALGAIPAPPRHPGTLALADVSFRVVDVEATGLSTVHDELIDVCVYEVKRGTVTKLIDTAVRPTQSVAPRIFALTGLDEETLARAPALSEIALPLLAALSGDCLVAHNAQADVGYLSQIVRRFDPHWACPPVACTLKLSRQLLAETTAQFSLVALAEALHLPLPTHRAAPDALCTAHLLARLLERAAEKEARTLDELIALSQRKARPRPEPQISPLLAEALPEGPGLYRFYAEGDRLLYLGQSASIRRRVKDHLYRAAAGASLEVVRRALRVDAEPCSNELEAFVREGRALEAEKPLLNSRLNEHGRVRYLRLSDKGALTLTATPTSDARYFGPLVLSRSERLVLRALRETFKLTPRDQKHPAADVCDAFLTFARAPLGDKPASAEQATWEVLLDVKRSIHRAEQERIDAARPFHRPSVVRCQAGVAYAIGIGRPTLVLPDGDLRAWLAVAPANNELDADGRRVSAFVRAHPHRVSVLDAAEVCSG